jgi:hypothetical protein
MYILYFNTLFKLLLFIIMSICFMFFLFLRTYCICFQIQRSRGSSVLSLEVVGKAKHLVL